MTKKHRSKKMSCDDDQYPKLFLYYCQGALIETKKDTKSIKLLSFKFIRFLYACNICNDTFVFYYKIYSCSDIYICIMYTYMHVLFFTWKCKYPIWRNWVSNQNHNNIIIDKRKRRAISIRGILLFVDYVIIFDKFRNVECHVTWLPGLHFFVSCNINMFQINIILL